MPFGDDEEDTMILLFLQKEENLLKKLLRNQAKYVKVGQSWPKYVNLTYLKRLNQNGI